jgi:hypothetical protein
MQLGWEPNVTFEELLADMVESDLNLTKRDAALRRQGCGVANAHE